MRGTGAVQVVLGEGEPGILRFVLEAEGFQVIGQARGESELRQVLDATHPSVIVLDAGISATAASDARARASGAQVVVVWPNGVRASVAEERVDPATVFQDLGGAVRRAAERATATWDDVVALPESPPVDASPPRLTVVAGDTPSPREPRRGSRRFLVVAAAWTLALTASAAAAFVVPNTLGLFERRGTPHAPAAPAQDRSPAERRDADPAATPSDEPTDTGRRCERADRPNGPRASTGRPDDPGRGCGAARGQEDRPADHGDGGGKAEGRPEHANGGDGGKGATDGGAGGGGNGKATGQSGANGGGGGNGPG